MKLISVTSALLVANVALGARFTEKRRNRAVERGATVRPGQSLPKIPSDGPAAQIAKQNNSANVEYSNNWAGAVLIGTDYTSVTGTFVVPTPKEPTGASSDTQYSASAWVGIDGNTAQNSILQTGVDFYVEDGQTSFDAWYEWYPESAYTFSGFGISAGDTIKLTITATSLTSGTALIENESSGKSVSHSFSSEEYALEELNAEWIVEDYESNFGQVPLANFGTVIFTDTKAISGSSSVGPSGATLIDLEQNGEVLTSVSVSGDEVIIKYI
ncbi:acid proteinase [Grosmannia clavigera kw1407]|uniref:Acid proteinase n=1 Tax=Grosmannia clavigera (strain kw1407 / UAMH 11150) TaxID=655863 RepID=F0XSW3_GROCL|nr:acid proteinase [Grosmannia clavigera kw1407]EFW99087.1 acid proteinase [Grosmannia clavigera kw1407]